MCKKESLNVKDKGECSCIGMNKKILKETLNIHYCLIVTFVLFCLVIVLVGIANSLEERDVDIPWYNIINIIIWYDVIEHIKTRPTTMFKKYWKNSESCEKTISTSKTQTAWA